MSPFYQSVDLQSRERLALAPGSYGTSTQPGLKILAYLDNASKPDKTGAMQHSFLVSATRPSREQLQQTAAVAGNGKVAASGEATPFDEPEYEGTAFLKVTIADDWKHPAALALAFTEASRTKEGKINHDYLTAAVESGEVDPQVAKDGYAYYRKVAMEKVLAANTPSDQLEAAVEAQYRKELMQISIKVGTLFTLQDWGTISRDPNHDPVTLVGVEFSGKVEASNFGDGTTQVVRVYPRKKEPKAA